MRPGRLAGWLVLAVVAVGALAFAVIDDRGGRSPEDRARDLASEIACPACDGQSVADSDSVPAKAIRERIDEQIDAGLSDAQIRDELEADYPGTLLTPGRSGVSSLVWTLPVVVLVAAFAGLGYAFVRWRGDGARRATDADRALVAEARDGDGYDGGERDGHDGDGHRGEPGDDDRRDAPAGAEARA